MKKLIAATVLGAALAFVLSAQAEEKKFEGTATCAKCDLGIEKSCTDVLQVKEGDKTITYYLKGEGDKGFHKTICKKSVKAVVTGTAETDGDKNTINASKIEVKS